MALPINIEDLITGQTVESERIEFKKGWNPEATLHTLCAFANDLNNWGGGYIIIGIEEKDGKASLPPVGLNPERLDGIQKDLLKLTNRIIPNYIPVCTPEVFMGKHILVIWAPGGDTRPYKAPKYLKKDVGREYYVRRGSVSKIAKNAEERQLLELAAKVPYDDRINHQAELDDLSLSLIQEYLKQVKSKLYEEAGRMTFEDLCRQMMIVSRQKEYVKPLNVGLLFFSDQPHQFFRGAKIDVVVFQDEIGDSFVEKEFTGPINKQLLNALEYIKTIVLEEKVIKVKGQAEAIRVQNYPFEAIEESLANALYHRSYEHEGTIEVSVHTDKIEILSFPGPLPPLDAKMLSSIRRATARDYRNRRIGDFFKELRLTEGRGTGFPKIAAVMKRNGSPQSKYETDEDRTYFLTTLPIHKYFLEEVLTPSQKELLEFCKVAKSRSEVLGHIGISNQSSNFKRHIFPLIELGYLTYTHPNNLSHKKQKYVLTEKGSKKIEIKKE